MVKTRLWHWDVDMDVNVNVGVDVAWWMMVDGGWWNGCRMRLDSVDSRSGRRDGQNGQFFLDGTEDHP